MGTCGLHNLNPLCTHLRLEVRNAELYDYWCPDALKNGNYDRIAVLSFLCYDECRDRLKSLPVLLDVDWIG